MSFAVWPLLLPCPGWYGWPHTVEVAFESIDVSGPEAAELIEPGIELPKWFRFQPVETALCVHRALDETGLAQHSQVLGHARLRHKKLTLDFSHRLLGGDQQSQDGAAVWLRDDFEYRFHRLYILQGAYTCQDIYKKNMAVPDASADDKTRKARSTVAARLHDMHNGCLVPNPDNNHGPENLCRFLAVMLVHGYSSSSRVAGYLHSAHL